jgi:hypothetical protein
LFDYAAIDLVPCEQTAIIVCLAARLQREKQN